MLREGGEGGLLRIQDDRCSNKTSRSYCLPSPIVHLLSIMDSDKEIDKLSVQVRVQSTIRQPDPVEAERGLQKAQRQAIEQSVKPTVHRTGGNAH